MNAIIRTVAALFAVVTGLPAFGQVAYCTQTKPTSVPGCTPVLSVPDTSLTGSWVVSSVPLGPTITSEKGIFIYTHGVGIGQSAFSAATPFGTLCLLGIKRSDFFCAATGFSGTQNTCVATYSLPIDCNSGALGIAVGEDVNVQGWYRDPPNVASANFTNAIFYTVQ